MAADCIPASDRSDETILVEAGLSPNSPIFIHERWSFGIKEAVAALIDPDRPALPIEYTQSIPAQHGSWHQWQLDVIPDTVRWLSGTDDFHKGLLWSGDTWLVRGQFGPKVHPEVARDVIHVNLLFADPYYVADGTFDLGALQIVREGDAPAADGKLKFHEDLEAPPTIR